MPGDTSTISLLPNERVVMASDQDTLILTNMRVRLNDRTGNERLVTIVLDAVASCSFATQSQPYLIVFAILAILGALALRGNTQIALFAIGAISIGSYWATRRPVLSITSSGGTEIAVPTKSMPRAAVIEFIDAVEKEKLSFLARLRWADLLPEN